MPRTIFEALDGKRFDSLGEAVAYEATLVTKLEKFQASSEYRKLIGKYNLDTKSLWHIEVEGDEIDGGFGSSRRLYSIGYATGKLRDVIAYAVEHPRFWGYYGPGSITLVEVIAV